MHFMLNPVIVFFTLSFLLINAIPSFSQELDNPGGDQPDISFTLGKALYPTNLENIVPNIDVKSRIAVLDNGFSREAILFYGLYLPVRIVKEAELPSQASSISLFVIPSGGLSDLKHPESFRMTVSKFVEDGGTLFVFSQRHGKEYVLLPLSAGETINGYGWLEDQSSLINSSILTMQHPVVSGLTTSKPHLNIDGFFNAYPRNGKPVLRNSISGQPVMVIYRYGRGNVVASALFSDWAYMHERATWNEVTLFSHLIAWVGLPLAPSFPERPVAGDKAPVLPESLPALGFSLESDNETYMAGSTATFTINLWNNEDNSRTIKVYVDGTGHKVQLSPHGASHLTYAVPVYSSKRLWVYFYDEKEIFLQTLRKGYTVLYPPD